MHHWKIFLPTILHRGYVECDGRRMEGVQAVRVTAGIGDLTRVELTLVAKSIELEAETPEQPGPGD